MTATQRVRAMGGPVGHAARRGVNGVLGAVDRLVDAGQRLTHAGLDTVQGKARGPVVAAVVGPARLLTEGAAVAARAGTSLTRRIAGTEEASQPAYAAPPRSPLGEQRLEDLAEGVEETIATAGTSHEQRTVAKQTAAKRTAAKRTAAKRTAAKRTAAKRTAGKRTSADRAAEVTAADQATGQDPRRTPMPEQPDEVVWTSESGSPEQS